jgi:hypothetical protein
VAKKKPTPSKGKRGKRAPAGQGEIAPAPAPVPPEYVPIHVTRADMRLTRQALRGDWPISTRIKMMAYDVIVQTLDPLSFESARTRNFAVRTLALFSGMTMRQAAIDLRREKQEGKTSEVSLADLVAEAEQRAEQRKHERDKP